MLDRLVIICCLLPGFVQAGEISANQLHRDSNGVLHASGQVVLKSKGFDIEADRILLDVDSQSGDMDKATVHFDGGYTFQGEYLQRRDLENFHGENVSFSACPEDDMSWEIVAKRADLDREEGTFRAESAWFEWGGVPVLYVPRWEHALSRRSGFLMPDLRQSTRRGTEYIIPIYWAAAPNWDVTYSPHWMSLRGLLSDVEWRHRSLLGTEDIQLRTVFDKQSQTRRSRLRSNMNWNPTQNIHVNVNVDAVDDTFHVADFPLAGENESAAYLTSSAAITWQQQRDSVVLSTNYNQLLGGLGNIGTLQIRPRLQTRHYFDLTSEQTLQLDHQTTVFSRNLGSSGLRSGVRPSWSLPVSMMHGAVAGSWMLEGQLVHYETNQFATSTSSYSALASSLQLETAFERLLADNQWRHEIKPIVRFDVSQTQDQSDNPRYDSTLLPLNISNILSGNRYSGWDRYEHMSRISMLLESSLQTKEGQDGVRTVLQGQLGVVWSKLFDSVDPLVDIAPQRRTSNLLAELAWMPYSGINMTVGGQRNPDTRQWSESHAGINWQDENGQYLHVNWQATDASHSLDAESLSFDGKARIGARWAMTFTTKYDLLRRYSLGRTAGLSYQHPCWHMTVESFQTYQVGSNGLNDVGARLLLAFDGLGSFGDK